MKIEQIEISSLELDPDNVNEHDKRSVKEIAKSLEEFGQQRTVVVSKDGVVVAGNGVVSAALSLGWEKIWVNRTELEGPKQVAYAIADNRTSDFSTLDKRRLSESLKKIRVDSDRILEGYKASGAMDFSSLASKVAETTDRLLRSTGLTERERKKIETAGNVAPSKSGSKSGNKPMDDDEIRFGVVVSCSSQDAQRECYDALVSLGFSARKVSN